MAATATIGLTGTVSMLHNNLSCSSSGWVASLHNSVVPGGGKLLLTKTGLGPKDGPEISQATSVRYLELPSGPVLVVSSTNGTQFYNEDATVLVYYVPINDPTPDLDTLKFHQGACLVGALQHIVIGTSKGSLLPVHSAGQGQFMALHESLPSSASSSVSDLAFSEVSGVVVSAHSSGELRVWVVSADGPYSNVTVLPAANQAPVRIASVGPYLLVAYGPGLFHLLNAVTYEVEVEVAAHGRWLSAVAIHQDVGLVATVGEDTVLNVWQIDTGTGQVGLQQSTVVTDKLLTGVAFDDTGAVVAAYDSSDLYHINF